MVSICAPARALIHVAFFMLPFSMGLSAAEPLAPHATALRFEVKLGAVPDGADARPRSDRLLVILGDPQAGEPRLTVGRTGNDTPPILGRDVVDFTTGQVAVLDERSALFPIDSLARLRPGTYSVQALWHTNPDLNIANAPGDLYSPVVTARLDPAVGGTVNLELSRAMPEESLPADTELVKYIKTRSPILSTFYNRPIFLRAGVILPRDFSRVPDRRYPVRVHVGGYGSRFTNVTSMMNPESGFHRVWMADDTPRMILIHLDGAGPLGDPYQIDSANHGPFGAAVTQELIPFIEAKYRGVGKGYARVVDGGSTGGWVSLALQVFYPEFFNGAWSFCPDGVDFRSFQLVNIYEDDNAYVNRHGFERPASREVSGETRYTMRHECQLENVLGAGDSWTLSGGQWGAWNATYGPRGPDGRPVPIWDPSTGKIDHKAAENWKAYDLRRILEENWTKLGPKLKGKLHIWIGEADDYFLNNAVHQLDAFLARAKPAYEGSITYGPGEGHCWMGISQSAMMKQMAARMVTPKTDGNLEESKVRPYTLPDPLVSSTGTKVLTPAEWKDTRRPELLRLFETNVYGKVPRPARPIVPRFEVKSEDKHALGGMAIRREVSIVFSEKPDGPRMDLLLFVPKRADGAPRPPVVLGLNFRGNHSIHADPAIALSRQWMRDGGTGVVNHQATESSRGTDASSWPVEKILARGYALATAYYGDIDPDYDDGFQNGIHPLFYQPGQSRPNADEWGSIGAWAWGLSRALDYLATAPEIDPHKVVLMGHSRLGKAALWAGAQDPRFAIVISVQSGCGGAALSKRNFGETVERINTSFPHWFCTNFRQYNDKEETLPVDQHELIALIAPRPVLVCSAQDDLWADPKGEFLSALAANPAYRLLGTDGLATTDMPAPARDQLIKSTIGYRIRPGKHEVTTEDWDAFMDFAEFHFQQRDR